MAKFYALITLTYLLVQIQGIFGAMNVTMGDVNDNQLTQLSSNNGNGNSGNSGNSGNGGLNSYICPRNGNCVDRSDPNYIIPKSYGTEKINTVFTDITTLEGFENNKKGLIVEACSKKQFEDKKCQTRKCAVNEDCLSGVCNNGSCMINRDNTLYECIDNNGIMLCGKYLQEPCTLNRECAGTCKNFVCTYKQLNALNTSPLLYYSVPILTIICLLLLFCCCCCCPGIFRWKVKEPRNNQNPPVVV